MSYEQILEHLHKVLPGVITSSESAHDAILNLYTSREHIMALLSTLRDDEQLNFNFLTSLCGVHYPNQKGQELGVVYHLHNWVSNVRVRVKVYFPKDDPHTETATGLWATANWMERQEYDFFGIIFTGHPDLRRILNVEDMEVFPMLKEYKLEDGTRTDKDDRFFGREGNYERSFD